MKGGLNVSMKLTNIKNIDSIEKGIKLLNMRNNEVVIIEDIKDNTIKIEGKDKYNSLATVKRWYKIIFMFYIFPINRI